MLLMFVCKNNNYIKIADAIQYTGGPPYPRVIRSKTYRGYVEPRILPNAIYNVI